MIVSALGHSVKSASAQMIVFIEVVEWERFFFDEKLIGFSEFLRFDQFQFFREHERDFRQLDRGRR